jgi:hypothetical protein
MPTKNRFGFTISDQLQDKINQLPRSVQLTPYLVYAFEKITDELQKKPQLKPENFSIRVIEQLELIKTETKKTTSKKKT